MPRRSGEVRWRVGWGLRSVGEGGEVERVEFEGGGVIPDIVAILVYVRRCMERVGSPVVYAMWWACF
jgi:hypothetical protein